MRHPDPPLTDGELTLRPGRPDDAAEIVPLLRDPEIPRWTRIPDDYQASDWHDWLGLLAAAPDTRAGFVIVDRDDNLLGGVGLPEIAGTVAQIGYWVAAHARGRRIAPRAIRLVTAWAHDELGIERIELRAHEDNHASRRAALHAGYVDTGERHADPTVGPPGAYVLFVSER